MEESGKIFLEYASLTALWIMAISLIFPLLRLFKGPTLSDRVVALDQISFIIVGIIICDVFYTRNTMLLDVVITVSLLLVFGSMIIARYLYKKQNEDG